MEFLIGMLVGIVGGIFILKYFNITVSRKGSPEHHNTDIKTKKGRWS